MITKKSTYAPARCLVRCDGAWGILTPCRRCRKPVLMAVSLERMRAQCACGAESEVDVTELFSIRAA